MFPGPRNQPVRPGKAQNVLSRPGAAEGGSSYSALPHTHPVAMKPPWGKYMQHRPLVMGANATGDRSSSAQILRSLRRKRGDTLPGPRPRGAGSSEEAAGFT